MTNNLVNINPLALYEEHVKCLFPCVQTNTHAGGAQPVKPEMSDNIVLSG